MPTQIELMTLEQILAEETAAGREPRYHYWYRLMRQGKILTAERVTREGRATWQCQRWAYDKFVAENLYIRDIDQTAAALRVERKIRTGEDGFYTLWDAAFVLTSAGYSNVSEYTLGQYCKNGIIPFEIASNGKRGIPVDVLRSFGDYKLKQGRPQNA